MAVQPYIYEIENLKQRLRDREVELVVLKNAIFGIDTKVTELEKKVKTPAATGPAGRATARPGTSGASTARGAVASKTTTAN